MKLGIDLDGVVASFVPAYCEKLTRLTGIEFPVATPAFPSTWHFERAAGVTREQESKVWDEIRSEPFWAKLLPMRGALETLRELDELSMLGRADVYFITSRPGRTAKRQSEFWLQRHGVEYPTVLIADDKGSVAKGLELDVFIDDRPENIADVFEKSKKTRVYLLDAPYNRARNIAHSLLLAKHPRITRVASVSEMLEREGLARKAA